METIILILLVILIFLVLSSMFRTRDFGVAMENTKRELETSKNLISDHAIKTLDTIKDMGSTVEKIMQQQKEAQDLGNSLKYLLQTPKLRGNYGEEILEEMLDRILPKGVWEKQYLIDENERVDAVIKCKDVIIPIDAKFPREIYERYLDAEGTEEKKRNWKAYEEGLKVQINSIKNKYLKPHKGTTDFVLMFIPSESIYYETIAERNYLGQPCHIYEYARSNNVVPVSPNTFYAFLQVVIMGIRNVDIIKSAKKLQEALIKIERSFKHFYSRYEEIGSAIEKAQNAYKIGDTHIKRFKDNIDSTIELDLPEHPQIENEKNKG